MTNEIKIPEGTDATLAPYSEMEFSIPVPLPEWHPSKKLLDLIEADVLELLKRAND
jgi:hypothetical protein